MQSLGMENLRVAYTSGLGDGETPAKWASKASFATHPSTKTEWPPKLAEGLNYAMICRRASKCEPLLRFTK